MAGISHSTHCRAAWSLWQVLKRETSCGLPKDIMPSTTNTFSFWSTASGLFLVCGKVWMSGHLILHGKGKIWDQTYVGLEGIGQSLKQVVPRSSRWFPALWPLLWTTLSLDCHVSPPRCLAQGLQRKQVAGSMGWTESLMGRTVFTEESEVTQSWPTLCDPMDCSLPGASVHGIFQARILEWVAISFSRRSSWPRDWTWVSHIVSRRFTVWATREVHWQVSINPRQGFCHKPYEVTVELQSRAPHLLFAGRVIHSQITRYS